MRKLPVSILASILAFVSCGKKTQTSSSTSTLPEVFIESFIQQKFELLEPFFPTVEFHKSLEQSGANQPDSAAVNFVATSNAKLKDNWISINERIKANKIDLTKVNIVESLTAHPFWSKKLSRTVVVYSYENKNWDDIEFIVGESNDKKFLLELPGPDKVFSMADSSLRASKDLRFEMEIRTPEFKKALQDTVEKIVSYVKESKLKELGDRLYYPDDVGSHEQVASQFMMKINSVMSDCGKPVYGDVNSLDVTDAKWIVIQLKCSNKFVHFAFVRTNGKLLLNDVDVAGMK